MARRKRDNRYLNYGLGGLAALGLGGAGYYGRKYAGTKKLLAKAGKAIRRKNLFMKSLAGELEKAKGYGKIVSSALRERLAKGPADLEKVIAYFLK